MLLLLLNYQQVVSPLGNIEGKTSLDSCIFKAELTYGKLKNLKKDYINLDEFSSAIYTNELMVEVEEEKKKKEKIKSPYTPYQRNVNPSSLLKFTFFQKIGHQFILINIPLYKLFHSWKIHFL